MAASSKFPRDDDGQKVVQQVLNAAALRRAKALSLAPAAPVAPKSAPAVKRKKDKVTKDNTEKVTPDSKLMKSGTASSLTSESTTPGQAACNLLARFDAVDGGGGGSTAVASCPSPMEGVTGPSHKPSGGSGEPTLTSGASDSVPMEEVPDISHMSTISLSPGVLDSIADGLASSLEDSRRDDHPGESLPEATPTLAEETHDAKDGQDAAVVPVATPSRALAMFWSKYKVPKGQTATVPSSTMDASDTTGAANCTEPTGVEGEPTVPSSTMDASDTNNVETGAGAANCTEPTGVEGEPTNTEHVEPPSSSKMTKLESSSSVDSMTLESGWRYDEKMKKKEAKTTSTGSTVVIPSPVVETPTVETMGPKEDTSTLGAATGVPTPPETVETGVTGELKFDAGVAAEFARLLHGDTLKSIEAQVMQLGKAEVDTTVEAYQGHPSMDAFESYMQTQTPEGATYKFGCEDPVDEMIVFRVWLQAMLNCKPVEQTPQRVPQRPSPTSVIKQVLTRATTVDMTPNAAAAPPATPPPAPAGEAATAPDAASLQQKVLRAKKAKWHRSMKSSKCPDAIKKKLKELQNSEGRNQEGWDALFNMFVECGENWLQCDLVTQNSDVREHARNGSWGLMSKVDLDEKYKDDATVKDLIERKTAAQQYESNPDFPDREDLRLYWCWQSTTETDRHAHLNQVGTQSSGRISAAQAQSLQSSPIVAAAPTGHLRSGAAIGELGGKGAGKGKDPAAKPKPKPKPKTAPKAKTPLQEATAAMKSSADAILECKSWRSKLQGAGLPEHMVDAMVKDTGVHLATIEAKRSSLETSLAEGKPDEEILVSTQGLVQSVKDYKAAATHVKKVSSKPKAKKAEAKEPDQQPGA